MCLGLIFNTYAADYQEDWRKTVQGLPDELQEHITVKCEEYGIFDYEEYVKAIIWHESRAIIDVPDNHNRNGSVDRGLMQINSINWKWLKEDGIDINDAKDNIEAGIKILSIHLDKYDIADALRAYAGWGKTGDRFSAKIIEMVSNP